MSLAIAAACGSSEGSQFGTSSGNGNEDGGDGSSGNPPLISSSTSSGGQDGAPIGSPIEIVPAEQTLDAVVGSPMPTTQFRARIISSGQEIPASWAIDRGEIGTIALTTGLFTASGAVGGSATITATYEGQTARAKITVRLKVVENGGATSPDAGGGAGGNGGVGGDPPGGSVSQANIDVLHGSPVADPNLTLLYPYDGTVWPRGILAPLLMWKPGDKGDYDALSIKIKEDAFDYEGFYAKNAPTGPFKNHPISQAAWKQMLSSNQGEEVEITLTFAKDGVAYGPLKVKWKVASAPLKGIVYYNSYGTRLAKNHDGALTSTPGVKEPFGGATLGVRGGSTDPILVAGGDGDVSYCRVCHSVAANGSALITQRGTGGQRKFSTYDLTQTPSAETVMSPEGSAGDPSIVQAPYAWPAIYPDGTMFFNDSSSADGSTGSGEGQPGNSLWRVASGGGTKEPEKITTAGWPGSLRAAFPAFSPDGKGLAFTTFAGGGAPFADKRSLAYATFDKATSTFGPVKHIYTPPNEEHSALYPAFLPTNDAVVFHVETEYNGRDYGGTRSRQDTNGHVDNDFSKPLDPDRVYRRDHGTHAELWWAHTNVAGTPIATRLDKLNGKGYLPSGPAGSGHEDGADETLNYEPTVNPVPSGGYAWVVFTSRRLYGNVATQNPFWSDPRYHDLTTEPTTKKLWVAAIDLNAPPGTDPSHPAFYLPAQELLAGNMRGYWVVDPCKDDGNGCESGDECCGGFCRPNASGALVCSNVVPICAQEFERCSVTTDCCNNPNYQCINGRCATPGPK
ncbi:MAG: hypothetical protein KIT84_15310 [Labilithrix sp.]|nr:hypothetical protein [Labilithrix sp.]MCW5812393.1 hypothetical protein [Labilithrix sp.]